MRSENLLVSPEHNLLSVAKDRDRDAFAKLFIYFAPRLKSYLRRLGSETGVAEELVQETMMQVWRKADRFDPVKATASTWIFAIARNIRIDAFRRERRPQYDIDDPTLKVDGAIGPDIALALSEESQRVRSAMKALSPDQARVVQMSFFGQLSHSEISKQLLLPLGTVKSRLRLAFGNLRHALKDIQ